MQINGGGAEVARQGLAVIVALTAPLRIGQAKPVHEHDQMRARVFNRGAYGAGL